MDPSLVQAWLLFCRNVTLRIDAFIHTLCYGKLPPIVIILLAITAAALLVRIMWHPLRIWQAAALALGFWLLCSVLLPVGWPYWLIWSSFVLWRLSPATERSYTGALVIILVTLGMSLLPHIALVVAGIPIEWVYIYLVKKLLSSSRRPFPSVEKSLHLNHGSPTNPQQTAAESGT